MGEKEGMMFACMSKKERKLLDSSTEETGATGEAGETMLLMVSSEFGGMTTI